MRKPLIGITPSSSKDTLAHGAFQRYVLNAAYADAVAAAGGIPVILPYHIDDAADLARRLDGVLMSGGADIDPACFGALTVHPATYGVSPERDSFELSLLELALSDDLPVLGICRGIQVLNVGFGGTLIQHIPDQPRSDREVAHRQHKVGIEANQPGHTVALATGNPLYELVGASHLAVNSFHHQAIDQLGAELVEIARAEDGIIEAVFAPERRFVLGVQWHPELMFLDYPIQLSPFRGLVEAAVARTDSAREALI